MANENMIKFYRGLVGSLPTTGENGALYITTDEGAIYYGTGTGMKRLGDFVQVDAVANLPAKAHEGCLYYCVAENILAKWNGTEWKQINKQPTAEEMKTLLGLGSMAYKSEVAEGDLNAELKAKVNAAAEGNHAHENKDVLDGITADKVSAWDAAEKNAKDHADGLNTAMNTRVEALEAVDHEHANKALLDTYTQTEENLADAVAKKHEHSNKTELDKIAAGDVAKWNGVVADHLTSADKIAFEDSIGDVNTALGEEVTRAKAAEKANADAITGIKNGTNINDFAGVESELAKKVNKTDYEADKATFATKTDIAKLAGVSEGANKVEASETNGNIKIDGVETVVYTHPDKHAIADVTGLQDALDGKQAAGNYSVEGHKHVKADITDFAHTHIASEITDLDATIKGYDYATKTEAQDAVDALANKVGTVPEGSTVMGIITNIQENAYDDTELRDLITENTEAIEALDEKVGTVAEGATVVGLIGDEKERAEGIEGGLRTDIDAVAGRMTTAEGKIADLETESAKHAIKTEVEGALALKADKSVVDAMYTNTQIDGFIAEVKKYADDNDADTKYGIVYDSDNKKIKLVEGGTDVEIDASAFIKDGMINTVTIDENDDLIITFNTDAGKENIVLPLDQLVDIYTGVEGDRVKVTVNADKSISADLVAGSINKDYLDDGVKASLALADSAIQSHQDISHLATKAELEGVDGKFANYTNTTDMNAKFDLKADKTQVATDIENAVKVETERATGVENDLDSRIKDLEDNKAGYATTGEVATAKSEAIAAAETKAGELDAALKVELQKEIDDDVKALADTVYAKTEVDSLLTWGTF